MSELGLTAYLHRQEVAGRSLSSVYTSLSLHLPVAAENESPKKSRLKFLNNWH